MTTSQEWWEQEPYSEARDFKTSDSFGVQRVYFIPLIVKEAERRERERLIEDLKTMFAKQITMTKPLSHRSQGWNEALERVISRLTPPEKE